MNQPPSSACPFKARDDLQAMPLIKRVVLFCSFALFAAPIGAQSIANGDLDGLADFQTFNAVVPAGWTGTIGSVDLFDATTAHHAMTWQASVGGGTFLHGFGFATNPEGFSQMVSGLTIGNQYEVTFEQSGTYSLSSSDNFGFWRVSFGAQVFDSAPIAIPLPGSSAPWQPESVIFTATATSQLLEFNAYPQTPLPAFLAVNLGLDTIAIEDLCTPTAGFEFVRQGMPPNPFALLPGLSGPPMAGSLWDPIIDHTTFVTNAVLDVYSISLMADNVPSPPIGTILCDNPLVYFFRQPGASLSITIPNDCTLVSVRLCLAGASIDPAGDLFLTNALDFQIGN